jgi:hypothetical protein
MYVCMYVCMYVQACVRRYVCMCVFTYTCLPGAERVPGYDPHEEWAEVKGPTRRHHSIVGVLVLVVFSVYQDWRSSSVQVCTWHHPRLAIFVFMFSLLVLAV